MSLFDSMRQGGANSGTSMEEAQRQFMELIKLHAYADQFIDRDEEHKLLQQAVDKGMSLEQGMELIAAYATSKGYAVERLIEQRAEQALVRAAADKKGLERDEFETILQAFVMESNGMIPHATAAIRLKEKTLKLGLKVKEGGLFGSSWFSKIGA